MLHMPKGATLTTAAAGVVGAIEGMTLRGDDASCGLSTSCVPAGRCKGDLLKSNLQQQGAETRL